MSEQKIDEVGVENDEPAAKVDDDDAENNITLPKEGDIQDDKDEEDEEKEDLAELAAEIEEKQDKEIDKGDDFPKVEGDGQEQIPSDETEKEAVEKVEGEATEESPATEEGEATVKDDVQEDKETEPSVAEKVSSVSIVEEEEMPEEIVPQEIDRDFYISRYKELMEERSELNIRNLIYNKKCVEYFRRKKVAHTPREDIPDVEEVENNYSRLLLQFEECQIRLDDEQTAVNAEIEKFQCGYDGQQKVYFEGFDNYLQLEKQVAKKLLYSTDGKKIPNEVIDRNLSRQRRKIEELIDMRLKYILTRNVLTKMERKLIDVDLLDEGFHVKDFEKLQAANDAYMKKLEEKDATLIQQRAVCSTYVEMLAHMKEQMNFEVKKCDDARDLLHSVETKYSQARKDQSMAKQRLRKLNQKQQEQHDMMGLAVHPKLLADFKETRKKILKLEADLAVLSEELEKARMEKAYRAAPSIFDKHCIPLKSLKARPKFHQAAFLLL